MLIFSLDSRTIREVGSKLEFETELSRAVYINDSVGQKTFKYDFDLQTGTITNKSLLIDRRASGGEPDGMVVEYEIRLCLSLSLFFSFSFFARCVLP
jgi:hypothetical protein